MPDVSSIATDPRLKKLLDAMQQGVQPISTDTSVPGTSLPLRPESMNPPSQRMAGGVKLPGLVSDQSAESNAPPSGLPAYPAQQPQQQMPIRVRLGSDKGLQGIDKSIDELKTEQQAAKDFPSSQVRNGEILPPKMHHGLKDRLESLGKGAVIGMGQIARQNPNASSAELLSGGATGAVVGGVSPVSIDALQRQAQIQRDQGELESQIGLQTQQAQLENAQQRPELETARTQAEAARAQQAAQREDQRIAETHRHNVEQEEERKNRPRAVRQPVKQADAQGNEFYAEPDTGEPLKDAQGNIRYASRAKAEKQGEDYKTLSDWNYKKQGEAESSSKDLRQQANAIVIKTVDDEEKKKDLLKRAGESEQNALKYRDEGDKAAVKIKSAPSTQPDTRKGTINKEQQQRWLKDNQGKTLRDMKALYPNAVIVN